MECLPADINGFDIFEDELKTFENLLSLLKTPVGYNSYHDPWDDQIL